MSQYVTVEELRDEGVAASLTDARLLRAIQRASNLIDAWTHRFFAPRAMTMLLDGTGHDILQIGHPIISIQQVRVLSPESTIQRPDDWIELPTYRVYNRHLTQGLLDPDDRQNPKIQYVNSWEGTRRLISLFSWGYWPIGVQNIEIRGLFGYTDPDPDEAPLTPLPIPVPAPVPLPTPPPPFVPLGKTPEMIKVATIMLAARDLLPLADIEGRTEAALAARIMRLRTRDQEISYSSSNSSTGGTTGLSSASGIAGNSEIMAILAPYCRGPVLGAV